MAPVSALLTHEIEQHEPRPDLQVARLSFDILGMIAAEPTSVEVQVLRPGRTIELLEATAEIGGRTVVRCRAWRLSRHDSSAVAGGEPARMPGPDGIPPWSLPDAWGGGFIDSVEGREVPGSVPGRSRAWLHTELDLVEGVESSPLARFLSLVDTINGVSARVSPSEWMFPNTDLTLHFWRMPTDPTWVGLEGAATFGQDGIGVTAGILHDLDGPLGRSEQILTVRPLGR